jgi:transcriptional regulator MraZ
MYPTRLDDKGRLKLPAGFQTFFAALREKSLFVTSMDRKLALIYPMAIWRENEKFFETYKDDPKIARGLAFNAYDLGAESEMDNQGRVLFPPELRRELQLETGTLRICAHKGKFEILSEKLYAERKEAASHLTEADILKAESAGLNL